MALFRYPKSKHTRHLSPPYYKNYHKYKPYLQKEFNHQCIYCMLADTLPRSDSFGVEHYKPKKQFPEFTTTYSNLFYACNCCNRRKGNFWPSDDQLNIGQFILNPCDHVMFDHLKYEGCIVKERSFTGQFMIECLALNDEKSIEYRSLVIDILESLEVSIKQIQLTIGELDKHILTALETDKINLLEKKDASLSRQNQLLKRYYELTNPANS